MADYRRLPGPGPQHWAWHATAACRGLDVEMFFSPERERGPTRAARESTAKAVCARCPVLTQCRAHALTTREPYGVWGGLTAEQRRAQHRPRHRPMAPVGQQPSSVDNPETTAGTPR